MFKDRIHDPYLKCYLYTVETLKKMIEDSFLDLSYCVEKSEDTRQRIEQLVKKTYIHKSLLVHQQHFKAKYETLLALKKIMDKNLEYHEESQTDCGDEFDEIRLEYKKLQNLRANASPSKHTE